MKLVLLLCSLIGISSAADKVVARMYYQKFMGHVHQNPSKDSTSLTTLQCAHSVKILDSSKPIPNGWAYVMVGEDKGFIHKENLSEKRPNCFQEKYPKFYQKLNLDVSEMYYWGKLYDQYLEGETKVK